MTTIDTPKESSPENKPSGGFLGFLIFLALTLGGIQYVSSKLVDQYTHAQVCDRYARAKTDDLESIVIQYKSCLAEFER